MLNDTDRERILECAKEYGATTVVLFGSSLESDEANDIDLGVRGIAPEL
jgi:predicted nucleotidyltransferase